MSKISVIIPVYNSEKTILHTIEAVKKQEGLTEKPEIIVVDDGSKDNTFNLLKGTDGIIAITQKNSGPATARNNGAKNATGSILVFTDSDTVPHKDWLQKLTAPFNNSDLMASTGTYSIENKGNRLAQLIQTEIEYKHSNYKDFVAFGGTYNLAIRKEIFDRIGGFNEDYKNASGEDVDICYKILKQGYKIRFVKDAIVGHFHPENLFKYLKTQFKHGFWRAKLYYEHPNKATGDDYTGSKEIIETLSAGFTIFSPFVFIFQNTPFFSTARDGSVQASDRTSVISNRMLLYKRAPGWQASRKGGGLPKADKGIFKYLSFLPFITLLFIEYTFVSKIFSNSNKNKNLPSKLYAAFVFSLRAIYRTLGFIKGLIHFI
ncbi:MAG: glycosyltransferase [Candidatus Riflebacteria bacterium]|nr:glycosyltransferase [Candidatus Riflebacteria bacterium]